LRKLPLKRGQLASVLCNKSTANSQQIEAVESEPLSVVVSIRLIVCIQSICVWYVVLCSLTDKWCDETTCSFGGVCVFDADGFRGCDCQFSCRDDR